MALPEHNAGCPSHGRLPAPGIILCLSLTSTNSTRFGAAYVRPDFDPIWFELVEPPVVSNPPPPISILHLFAQGIPLAPQTARPRDTPHKSW
jgi:hypothetical protein